MKVQIRASLRAVKMTYLVQLLTSERSSLGQVEGVLTVAESQRFIDTAESIGFEHQSSRGPAFGEVTFMNGILSQCTHERILGIHCG